MNFAARIQAIAGATIAVFAVVGTFVLIFYQVVNNRPSQLPDIIIAMNFAVIGAYINERAQANGARQTATSAVQTAVNALNAGDKTNVGSTTGTS